jgi:hypothetical protein
MVRNPRAAEPSPVPASPTRLFVEGAAANAMSGGPSSLCAAGSRGFGGSVAVQEIES